MPHFTLAAGQELVDQLGRWRLTRWQYENAPLVAERECGTITVEVDTDGAIDASFTEERSSLFVPADVLTALIKDYEERKARR